MEKKATKRVQIELADKSFERLNALKDKTEATSYSEVMKNALRLYESIINQYDAGKRLYLKDVEGQVTEYEVF
jgi:metal-responsive CopG/Arc/MetJ family transcriptional regulator